MCMTAAMHSPARAQRGLTLIELMVVVSLVAIVMGIGVPAFQGFIVGQRVKTASFDVAAALLLARSEAIKRNTIVSLNPAAGGWSGGWTIDFTVSGATTNVQTQVLNGVDVVLTPNGLASIDYPGTGRISTSPKFQISSGSSIKCVSVGADGYPNTKSASC